MTNCAATLTDDPHANLPTDAPIPPAPRVPGLEFEPGAILPYGLTVDELSKLSTDHLRFLREELDRDRDHCARMRPRSSHLHFSMLSDGAIGFDGVIPPGAFDLLARAFAKLATPETLTELQRLFGAPRAAAEPAAETPKRKRGRPKKDATASPAQVEMGPIVAKTESESAP